MVDRRIVSSDNVVRIALRIKAARTLTGLNQEEFAEQYDFGYASVKNWELGKSIPRSDTVLKIVSSLREGGVQTTRDWLLYGSGSGPTHLDKNLDNIEKYHSLNPAVLDETILGREIHAFERWCYSSCRQPTVAKVADDSMEPFFSKGDILGADGVILSSYAKLPTSIPFLVELEPGFFQPRFLRANSEGIIKYACSTNGHQISELNYSGLGKIVWIRKLN